MKWNSRTLIALVLVSMLTSSMATFAIVKGTSSSPLGSVATASNELFSLASGQEYPKEFAKLHDAFQIIKKDYVDKVPDEKLIEGAIQGMISALDDPYSDYMDPVAAEEFNSALHSSFQGIGAEVTLKDGKVTVVSPFKDSPAELAGLRPNDQILSVNGEPLDGLDLQKAVMKIRGPKGSKATLKIARPGASEVITVVVTRDDIPLETVYSSVQEKNGQKFGILEMSQFASNTAKDFLKELEKLEKQGIKGLIIDVRGNPGGYLTAVKEIGEVLVPNKDVIVKIQYGQNIKEIEELRSKATAKKPYPIVVLIDGGSASASEILAGAMKESGGYTLVGETTFGKGTVQNTVEMNDKSQLKLTIAKWLSPKGEWIHKKGFSPDVKVTQPDYFKTVQLPVDKVLARDMSASEVKNLQLILTGLKLAPGRQDGYFDEKTEAAVKRFQTTHKLPATGKVDKATAEKMQSELIGVMRDPKNDAQLQKALEVIRSQVKGK